MECSLGNLLGPAAVVTPEELPLRGCEPVVGPLTDCGGLRCGLLGLVRCSCHTIEDVDVVLEILQKPRRAPDLVLPPATLLC